MDKQRSPRPHGGPATIDDLDQEIEAILGQFAAEPWVISERKAILKARVGKRAKLAALGLHEREPMTPEAVRRVVIFSARVGSETV